MNAKMVHINANTGRIDDNTDALETQIVIINGTLDGLRENVPDDTFYSNDVDAMRDGLDSDDDAMETDVAAGDLPTDVGNTIDGNLVCEFGIAAGAKPTVSDPGVAATAFTITYWNIRMWHMTSCKCSVESCDAATASSLTAASLLIKMPLLGERSSN